MKPCLNILKPQPLTFAALAVGIAFFSFTQNSHAGFEWIPASPPPAPKIEKVHPSPSTSTEAAPMDEAFLPIPGGEATPAPLAEDDMSAAPEPMAAPAKHNAMANNTDAPMPITSRPHMKTLHMGSDTNEAMQAEAAMQHKPMATPETMATPMPMDLNQPEPMPLEQPPQKAIMPADTPEEVKAAVANNSGGGLKVDPYPVANPSAPIGTPTVREPFAQTPVETKDVVGFGTDIPLALALQQVAPAGYAFSFGESINPGAKVSWSGGDNWVNVMQGMIEPLGLQASIRGRVIFVNHQHEAAAAPQIIESPAGIEPPADIEPAAGMEQPVNLNRVAINDPGQSGQTQPQKTVKVLSERQPLAKIAPAAGEERMVWEAKAGDSLKETLETWSKTGNFDVTWSAMHDYTIESDVLVAGEFDMALKSLINDGISKESAPSFVLKKSGDDEKPTLIVKEPV